ncbi:hypothetical protein EV385_6772 [Krasilnikovia cinnamomea]|uniref:Uncharacterized protein n=1 Tax=Krasilnikovia cinnamomea TaxID=349313 RepID=A0A4Q7Z9X5_9ACTN|nr:hypothetical protein [Krasilnikovia cinnamomea]RZU46695.1 hypothetical protein EV385_6772 [Krasilnikovia cinnamomea]
MTRRWVRFELPVMVCVDIDDHIEHEQVTTVVLGVDHEAITPARDTDGNYLIYDADAHRVHDDDPETTRRRQHPRQAWLTPGRNRHNPSP